MKNRQVVLGIVAEYDPFHNGHEYHLSAAKKAVQPDSVYVVLSPCIKQRGTLSVLSPHDRAACVLHSGADAVFLLPVLWTLRDAEHYAMGSVSLLCSLGVTHIAFGVETNDPALLHKTADFLENPPSSFHDVLISCMEDGNGYPASLSQAVSRFLPESGRILSLPNNILGICYLRALKKLRSDVKPVMIPRTSSDHDCFVSAESPSASAVRNALIHGNYSKLYQAVPPFSAGIIRKALLSHRIPDPEVWNNMMIECLRFSDTAHLPDLSEGLGEAIKKKAAQVSSEEDLIAGVTSRRYTASRISRICALAMLGVTDSRIKELSLPGSSLLLALRKSRALTERWKNLPLNIAVSPVQWEKYAEPEEIRCWRLWAACCHLPDTLPFTEKIYTE